MLSMQQRYAGQLRSASLDLPREAVGKVVVDQLSSHPSFIEPSAGAVQLLGSRGASPAKRFRASTSQLILLSLAAEESQGGGGTGSYNAAGQQEGRQASLNGGVERGFPALGLNAGRYTQGHAKYP